MGRVHLITSVGCWWLIVTVVNSRGKEVTTEYRVSDTVPDKRVASPAYLLEKVPKKGEAAEIYTVSVRDGQLQCECQDNGWRKHHCKHLRSLMASGILPKGLK